MDLDKLLFLAALVLVLSSGSAFGALYLNKRFEQMLPFTFTAIVAVQLVFGVLGMLRLGFFAALALAVLLWLLSLLKLREHKGLSGLKVLAEKFFSPGFFAFAFLALLLLYTNYGRVPQIWDEFSHWADAAKTMVLLDDFVTNPASAAWFPSYPPGMTLIQYFFEELYILISGSRFLDWMLYYSYQLFMLSFLLVFIPRRWKGALFASLLCTLALLLAPSLLFESYVFGYSTTYIDPFLAVVLGSAIGYILCRDDIDACDTAYVCCAVFMLVLSKAAGLLLGVFVLMVLALALYWQKPAAAPGKAAAAALSLALPYLLWLVERKSSAIAQSFSSKDGEVSLSVILSLLSGNEGSYRQLAFDHFYAILPGLKSGQSLVHVPLWLVLAGIILLLFFVQRDFRSGLRGCPAGIRPMPLLLLAEMAVYTVGMSFTFALKFVEEEAVISQGAARYLCIVLLALLIVLIIVLIHLVQSGLRPRLYSAILALCLVLLTPSDLVGIANRQSVAESQDVRAQFVPVIENVQSICPEGSRVYVVGQQSYHPAWLQIKYGIRPMYLQDSMDWYRLNEGAEDALDAGAWMAELEANYDYVAIFREDGYFISCYGGLFDAGSPIEEGAVYIVDKENSMLIKQS